MTEEDCPAFAPRGASASLLETRAGVFEILVVSYRYRLQWHCSYPRPRAALCVERRLGLGVADEWLVRQVR